MFSVTDKALEMILEHTKNMEDGKVIRIYLKQGG